MTWHEDHDTLVEVAHYGHDTGELNTAVEVLDFFEKPWHFPEIHEAWARSRAAGEGTPL